MISNDLFWTGCRHIFSPTPFTKKELVETISKHYELNIKVTAKDTYKKCDRTLSTKLDIVIEVPELDKQISEMKNFIL